MVCFLLKTRYFEFDSYCAKVFANSLVPLSRSGSTVKVVLTSKKQKLELFLNFSKDKQAQWDRTW